MIQRIQTVYLFLIAVLAVTALCLPAGRWTLDGALQAQLYPLHVCLADGGTVGDGWALFALLLIVAVSSMTAIFLFRKRMLQVRITLFNALLLLGYYVVMGVFVAMLGKPEWGGFTVGWAAGLPAVALILDYLAFRAIMKDEMIVRSLDRLR